MSTLTQREIWASGLGDVWLKENREILGKQDFVSEVIELLGIKPGVVLEIGCSNGWRLLKLKEKYGCIACGIDPSPSAIAEAVGNGLDPTQVVVGTADRIGAQDKSFDVVIFGWCLCFIAPEDWFNVANEAARILKDDGYIIIDDFIGSRPMRIEHRRVTPTPPEKFEISTSYIYHFDWPRLWTRHPGYKLIHEAFYRARGEACSVIQKKVAELFLNEQVKS